MDNIFDDFESNVRKTIDNLKSEYDVMRVGRANPKILDKVRFEYCGSMVAINSIASISNSGARELLITPWDKSVVKSIEKALYAADLGANPVVSGDCLRLTFAQPTEETRKLLVKDVKKLAENAKVSIRNLRRDLIEKLKKGKINGELTEDELKREEKKAQNLVDKYVKEVGSIAGKKEEEIKTL